MTAQPNSADAKTRDALVSNIVSFWGFFNANIAHLAHQVLSIRDLLSWVDFINAASSDVETSLVFAHGAQLVLLDGLGLGVGLSVEVCRFS